MALDPTEQRIARVLAYCHNHCDDEKETEIVAWVAEKFADDFIGDARLVRWQEFFAEAASADPYARA